MLGNPQSQSGMMADIAIEGQKTIAPSKSKFVSTSTPPFEALVTQG